MSINNGAWEYQVNRAQIAFSDEEVFLLSHIDEHWHEPVRYPGSSILEHEMICQRNMVVRGKRLWSYHERLGDLDTFFPPNAAIVRAGNLVGYTHINWSALPSHLVPIV